jgi:hypothetical protein
VESGFVVGAFAAQTTVRQPPAWQGGQHPSPGQPASTHEVREHPQGRWRIVRIAGWVALTIQLVVMLIVSGHFYHRFDLSLDFTMFHQAWYEIAHGHLDPQATFIHLSFWRDQSGFIIWLLAPIYYLYPHAIDLLWIQDLAAVGAELVAFLWLVEALERRPSSLKLRQWLVPSVTLILMLANPWIYLTIIQDFHVETLTTLFLVLAGREVWRQRPARAWIWVGATLLTGTVGGLSVVALGLAAVLARQPAIRRQGLAIAAVGIGWIGLIVSLPADLGGGANTYAYLEGPGPQPSGVRGLFALGTGLLSHPGRAFHMIGDRTHLLYENLAPFGFVGVLWPWAGVVILFLLLVNVLNLNPAFIAPSFQNFSIYVLGAAGSAMVVGRTIDWRKGRLIALFLAGVLVVNALFFSIHRLPHISIFSVTPSAAKELGSVLERTPSDAEVISSFGVSGRFGGRRFIYVFSAANSGIVGAPPHPTLPVSARTVVFVITPYQGNEPVNVIPAIPYIRDQLHTQVLTERAGVYAYLWHPPAGVRTVTLPFS